MTSSVPHTHVRLRDLSELVAGIPYMIGFPPTDSLVLFTLRQCPHLTLSTTIRADLPGSEHAVVVADELAAAVVRNEAVAVIAVVVGDDAEEHRTLVEELRKALADREVLLTHASWVRKVVHGEQWQCYDEPLCAGVVPDPQSSALAAAVAVAGETTYPNREAVAAHLAPDPEEVLARRRKLLEAYRTVSAHPYTEEDLAVDLVALGLALDRAVQSYDPPVLNDHQLVRLADALSRTTVKDECLAVVLSEDSEPGERLWSALVRSLPAPERAEPAFLLAMSAYLRGAGVLASLALKIALEAQPDKELAILLDRALRMGVPPEQLRTMLFKSIVNKDTEVTVEPDDDPPWDTTPESPGPVRNPQPPRPEPPTPEQREAGPPSHETQISESATSEGPILEETTTSDSPLATDSAPTSVASGEGPAEREHAAVPVPANESAVRAPRVAPPSPSLVASSTEAREDREYFCQPVVAASGVMTKHAAMDALTAFLPPPTGRSGPV